MDAYAEEQVVVVGGGPVGMRFADDLCRLSPRTHVLVVNDERYRPYDRVRLSSLVARELAPQDLYDDLPSRLSDRVTLRDGSRIVAIDRQRRLVRDESAWSIPYDRLVLATGSRPRVPDIPGAELGGVFVFRSMGDAEKLLARQVSSRSTLVIGGGLLGLEAARAMCRFNTRIHVIEHERRLMFNQLDDEAAALLRAHIEKIGIQVHTGASVQQIVGTSRPQFVRLRDGTEIECDTVLIATGIVPNVELARDAGLAVGRGIRVDDTMRTTDPAIYAIGECCEHRDAVYGLVGPGLEQASVAASHIAGRAVTYRGSIAATSLKVVGRPLFTMGEIDNSAKSFTPHRFHDGDRYRRLNVHRGRIIGAVGFGEWDVARLRSAGLEGARVWPWQLRRFRRSGSLWPAQSGVDVAAWPDATIVCNCRGVTRQRLSGALAAGACSVAALATATGASTVCGSCKPLLANLVGGAHTIEPPRKALFNMSAVVLLATAVAAFVSLPYADSMVDGLTLDVLWTSSLAKQSSGFTLAVLAVAVSLLSLRKRLRFFEWLRFSTWQSLHVAAGLVVMLVLLLHTGFRFGENLNAWLMTVFVGIAASGAVAGAATAFAQSLSAVSVRRLRSVAFWGHVLLLWPLLPLLGFHVLKSYWF